MEWEEIPNPSTCVYYRRCSIPGGWIVEAITDVIHDLPMQGLQNGFEDIIEDLD